MNDSDTPRAQKQTINRTKSRTIVGNPANGPVGVVTRQVPLEAETTLDSIGSFVTQGRYRLIAEVATGGMGKVYLADQLGVAGFEKTVGIKTIRRELVESPVFRSLFVEEAKLVADLVHENIQQVYGLIEMGGAYAIVMEWVHGLTFEDINTRLDELNDYLPPDLAVFMVSRAARALAYAHTKRDRHGRLMQIVHRDVSPVNIFASWQGVVKLADFGIAKTVNLEAAEAEPNHIMGKVPYMSPEQALGEDTDARTDIFALGLVLFEMLTGEQIYPTDSAEEVREWHRTKVIPSPREWNPAIPPLIDTILSRMLQPRPEARYQTAADVVKELELYMYSGGYGPTNERLAEYLHQLFPEVDKQRLLAEEMILPR